MDKQERYENFWKPLVENKDGSLNKEAIIDELADFYELAHNAAIVYCHVTGNTVSKVTHEAADVIRAADDAMNRQLRETIEERLNEMLKNRAISDQTHGEIFSQLDEYF